MTDLSTPISRPVGRPPKYSRPPDPVVVELDWPDVPISRFSMPDLTKHGLWLLDRLRDFQMYHHLTERILIGWLRGVMESNEWSFLKSNLCVALAHSVNPELCPALIVKEVFVFCMGRDPDGIIERNALMEGAIMYREFERWGHSLGATELVGSGVVSIEGDSTSDVPKELIERSLNRKIKHREVGYIKLTG